MDAATEVLVGDFLNPFRRFAVWTKVRLSSNACLHIMLRTSTSTCVTMAALIAGVVGAAADGAGGAGRDAVAAGGGAVAVRALDHVSKLSSFLGLWLRLTGCKLLTHKSSARPCQPWLMWHDVCAGACSGEPGEDDESVAALLLRLRDPRSGRPLPRARLWRELSVRIP